MADRCMRSHFGQWQGIRMVMSWGWKTSVEIQYQSQRSRMEAARQSRQAHSHKFIIKPRGSINHIKSEAAEDPNLTSTDAEVDLFTSQLALKGRKTREVLSQKSVNADEFFGQHLQHSTCFKTMVRANLDRMLNERRLGRGLKGMNKANLTEIEGHLWPTLTRELELFLNAASLDREKEQLSSTLARRKQEILGELSQLRAKRESRGGTEDVTA